MHSLEIIILRNAQAAGRELGHAVNDQDDELARRIDLANVCYHVMYSTYSARIITPRENRTPQGGGETRGPQGDTGAVILFRAWRGL